MQNSSPFQRRKYAKIRAEAVGRRVQSSGRVRFAGTVQKSEQTGETTERVEDEENDESYAPERESLRGSES